MFSVFLLNETLKIIAKCEFKRKSLKNSTIYNLTFPFYIEV